MRAILLLLVVSLAAVCLFAQDTAEVSGTVTDAQNAVVPGVAVTVTRIDTSTERKAVTNSSGIYSVPGLQQGKYEIQFRKDGFQTLVRSDVDLHAGDRVRLDFELKVGPTSQSVSVTGGAETINTSDATVSTVIDRQFVENIPMNGRSFQSLILLTPGVVATKAGFAEQGQFSVNGQRADSNYYTVDGVSSNVSINAGGGTGQAGAGLLPATSVTGGFNNLVSVDALQEFRIQTSTYAPEYGRTPGGQISLVTRSGTNSLHGSASEYLRNDVLDANNWFANANKLAKPRERQNDFGGVLGGPIFIPHVYDGRNKTFFFFSYEGLRLRQPQTVNTVVPSLSLRQSAPAVLQPVLNAFPIPNGPDAGNGLAQYFASYSDPSSLDAASLRLDHQITERVTFFARFNLSPSNSTQRAATATVSNPESIRFDTKTLTSGTSWAITPAINNEFRFNWSRVFGGTSFYMDNFGGAVPLSSPFQAPFENQNAFLSVFVINTSTTAVRLGRNGEGTQGQFNFVDNFQVNKGSHQMRFGIDHRYLFPSAYQRSYDLQYQFTTAANVNANIASFTPIHRLGQADYAYNNFSAFAQDTWKLTRRLTLTYGIRWDVDPAPHGRNSTVLYAANQTDNVSQIAFAPPGTPMWKTSYGDFAPRFGLAYKPFEERSLVLRGGFGVFYDLPAGAISNVVILSPNVVSGATFTTSYPVPGASVPIPPFSLTGPFANVMVTDPNLKLPYTLQWNMAVEQALGSSQTLSVSYLGAAGRRLLRQDRYLSASTNFPTLAVNRNSAKSDYDALQVQFQRHLTHGLQAIGSYTWSHSLDSASNDSTALPGSTNINVDQERGPSDFDVRHSVSGAITYDIPAPHFGSIGKAILGDWGVDSIFTARTATPVDVVVSRNLGFGSFNFRPDVVSGIPYYLDDSTVAGGKRINNTVNGPLQIGPFLIAPDLRQGTLSRNALRGFASNQLNFALRRKIVVKENFNIQFRAEFFNLFNHPNFSDPSGSLGSLSATGVFTPSLTFGRSTTTLNQGLGTGGQTGGFSPLYNIGGPRSIQVSLKLAF